MLAQGHLLQERLGARQTLGHVGERCPVMQQPRLGQHQLGMLIDHLARQTAQPALQVGPAFLVHGRVAMRLDQPDSFRHVTRGQGMLDRFVNKTVAGEPGAGPDVELCDLLRAMSLLQLDSQQPAKQMVAAIPLLLRIDAPGKQARLRQPLQVGLSVPRRLGHPRHRVAQRAAEPVQDGGLEQELLGGRGNVREHLAHQIVHHVAIIRRQLGQVTVDVIVGGQREGRQTQPGRPPLGAFRQQRDGWLIQRQSGRLLHEDGDLCRG